MSSNGQGSTSSSPVELLCVLARSLGAPNGRRVWEAVLKARPGAAARASTVPATTRELIAASAWNLEAAGRPSARKALELLCARLLHRGLGRNDDDERHTGACAGVLRILLQMHLGAHGGQHDLQAQEHLGVGARRELYSSGVLPYERAPASFFRIERVRHSQLAVSVPSPETFGSDLNRSAADNYPDALFDAVALESPFQVDLPALPESKEHAARWFELAPPSGPPMLSPSGLAVHPQDDGLAIHFGVALFDRGPRFDRGDQPGELALQIDIQQQADHGRHALEGRQVQPSQGGVQQKKGWMQMRRRRQAKLLQRQAVSDPLGMQARSRDRTKLDALWMSNIGRVDERAHWMHPDGFGVLSGPKERVREAGQEWVRSAILCMHGAQSRFFAVMNPPGGGVQVFARRPRAAEHRGAFGGGGAGMRLCEDWAQFSTRLLRLRSLSGRLSGGCAPPEPRRSERADCGLTMQAFGGALRDVLAALDKDFSEAKLWNSSAIAHAPTPLGLWVRARPWTNVVLELARLCGCDPAMDPQPPLPTGVALLERLFEHCRWRQVSTCLWQVKPQAQRDAPMRPEMAVHYMLQKTIEPYLHAITSWAFIGKLQDPYAEFLTQGESRTKSSKTLVAPAFLQSMLADAYRSGRLVGMLAGTPWADEGLTDALSEAGPAKDARALFFDYPADVHRCLGFLPSVFASKAVAPEAGGAAAEDATARGSVTTGGRISMVFSLSALEEARAHHSRRGLLRGVSESVVGPTLMSTPSLRSIRGSSKQRPLSKQRVPSKQRRWTAPSTPSGASAAALERQAAAEVQHAASKELEAEEQRKKQQQQRELREALNAQVAEQRKRQAAERAAKRQEKPEALLLEASTSEAAIARARSKLLQEHAQQERRAAAEAAYLHWRLRRLRLSQRRRKFLLDEVERLHEELLSSAARPQPQRKYGTWGPVVNPFENFTKARSHMLALPLQIAEQEGNTATAQGQCGSHGDLSARGSPGFASSTDRSPPAFPDSNFPASSDTISAGAGNPSARRADAAVSQSPAPFPVFTSDAIPTSASRADMAASLLPPPLQIFTPVPDVPPPVLPVPTAPFEEFADSASRRDASRLFSKQVPSAAAEMAAMLPPAGMPSHRPAQSPFEHEHQTSGDGGGGVDATPLAKEGSVPQHAAGMPSQRPSKLAPQYPGDLVATESGADMAARHPIAACGDSGPAAEDVGILCKAVRRAIYAAVAATAAPHAADVVAGAGDSDGIEEEGEDVVPMFPSTVVRPSLSEAACGEDEDIDHILAADVMLAADMGAVPLEVSAERCVVRPLQLQAKRIDAIIARHFVDDLQVLRRLYLLDQYILLGESRLVDPFIIEALDRYASVSTEQLGQLADAPGAFRLNGLEGSLNLLFQATVVHPAEPEDDAFLNKLHITVPDIVPQRQDRARGGAGPIEFLDGIRFDLEVEFPLSLIFPADALEQYSKLFRLFAVVTYALRCVSSAWQRISRVRSVPNWTLALRHNMHHFLLTLQRYFLMDVVAVEFAVMEERILGACSLNEILAAHGQFLQACVAKCFLDEGAEVPLSAVVGMLDQIILLHLTIEECPSGILSPAMLHKLRGIERTFRDMKRKLKLSAMSGADQDGVARYAGQEDFLEEWLEAWSRRMEK